MVLCVISDKLEEKFCVLSQLKVGREREQGDHSEALPRVLVQNAAEEGAVVLVQSFAEEDSGVLIENFAEEDSSAL